MTHTIEKLMTAESKAIDAFFRANKIVAVVNRKTSFHSSLGVIFYGLKLSLKQDFAAIERLQRELTATLLDLRKKMGFPGGFQVLPASNNGFGLTLPHPQSTTLYLTNAHLESNRAHRMLLGMSVNASGRTVEHLDFNDPNQCQVLVTAMTGGGKSKLLQTMLLSLCYATDPRELQLVMVDLKNEDLVPFENLPHTMTFARDRASAAQAIESLVAEKQRRIDTEENPYRIILVIDEIAQMAEKQVAELLGDLASSGRSKQIHLLIATQQPSEVGGLGSLMKANFPVRLVGKVAPQQSHIATGKAKVFAHLLPGRGSFLLCDGVTEKRFQSFFVQDVEQGVRTIQRRWGKQTSQIVLDITPRQVASTEVIDPKRNEIADLAEKIRPLFEQNTSKNSMAKHAFGKPYAGSYAVKIDAAINYLTSTASTTQTSTTASTVLFTRVRETVG